MSEEQKKYKIALRNSFVELRKLWFNHESGA